MKALGQVRPPIGHLCGLDKISLIQSEMASKKWQKNSFSKITRKIAQLKPHNVLNTDRKRVSESIDVKIVFLGAVVFELCDISHMRPPKTFHTPPGYEDKNFFQKNYRDLFSC